MPAPPVGLEPLLAETAETIRTYVETYAAGVTTDGLGYTIVTASHPNFVAKLAYVGDTTVCEVDSRPIGHRESRTHHPMFDSATQRMGAAITLAANGKVIDFLPGDPRQDISELSDPNHTRVIKALGLFKKIISSAMDQAA